MVYHYYFIWYIIIILYGLLLLFCMVYCYNLYGILLLFLGYIILYGILLFFYMVYYYYFIWYRIVHVDWPQTTNISKTYLDTYLHWHLAVRWKNNKININFWTKFSKNVSSSWYIFGYVLYFLVFDIYVFGYILYFLVFDIYHVAMLVVLMSIHDSTSSIVSRRPY